MIVIQTELPDVVVLEPKVYGDARGFFFESWNEARYAEAGLTLQFVQDNVSSSTRGVLRGLHMQHPGAQGKLVSVLEGAVFDVAVDIRRGSPFYRKWVATTLSSDNRRQFYLPPGFAHGFQVLTDTALISYKCTDYYRPDTEATIAWNDPAFGIEWPLSDPILSEKDRQGCLLRDLPPDRQPEYR